jgi:uncharacterized Fe-S cluster-containing radical SAM superfamily protein
MSTTTTGRALTRVWASAERVRATGPARRPEVERVQVFYVNIGGGELTVGREFWELVDYPTAHHVGVRFSTNGVMITPEVARRLLASDYVDVQISLDGATPEVNDAVRGTGSYDTAFAGRAELGRRRVPRVQDLGGCHASEFSQLDDFKALAGRSRRSCASLGCVRRGVAPTLGTRCTRRPRSSGSSATGSSHMRRVF